VYAYVCVSILFQLLCYHIAHLQINITNVVVSTAQSKAVQLRFATAVLMINKLHTNTHVINAYEHVSWQTHLLTTLQ
jgi:hypothetical protein